MAWRPPLQDAVRGEYHDLAKLMMDMGGLIWTENKVPYVTRRVCPATARMRVDLDGRWQEAVLRSAGTERGARQERIMCL